MKTAKKIDRTILMREAPVKGALIQLALPSIAAMCIMAMYNFIDTLFVGMLNDTNAMAGVSIGYPIFILILAFGQTIGMGASSCVGRLLGAGKKEEANRAAALAVCLGVVVAALVFVVGFLNLERLLVLMGATDEVMEHAKVYCRWLIVSGLFQIMNIIFNNLLRTEGAAKRSMMALMVGSVTNIILDPIFMFDWGLGLGLEGAALATATAQMCSTLYICYYYLNDCMMIKLNKAILFTRTSKDKEMIKEIIRIGSPMGAMQVLTAIAFGVLNSAAGVFGASAVATLGICNKIYGMVMQVMAGYVQAYLPFTAFNIGAKQYRRVKEGFYFSLLVLVTFGLSSTILFNMIPEVFIGMFTQDQEVLQLGVNCLKAQTYLLAGVGVINIMNATFQATAKAKEAMLLAIGRQGLFFIPLVLILPNLLVSKVPGWMEGLVVYPMANGLYGVMFAQPIADLITLSIAITLGIRTITQINKWIKEEEGAYEQKPLEMV